MRNQNLKKRRRHHPADEQDKSLGYNQWSSTDMLRPQTCLAFCSSKGISELLRDAVTMPAGLRIYTKVNGKETDDKQGCSRKVNSDQTTKCTTTYDHKAAATSKLREEIQRHTANRNMQMELGRLHEASLRHSGLDVPGLNRMNDLKQKVLNK